MSGTPFRTPEPEAPAGLFESYAELNPPFSWARLRRGLSGSFGIHAGVIVLLSIAFYHAAPKASAERLVAMMPSYLIEYPMVGGDQGGGGGGGGKEEQEPPNKGDVPPAVDKQLMAPDIHPPELPDFEEAVFELPPETSMTLPTIQAPTDFPARLNKDYGDLLASLATSSAGRGTGGGIGDGSGTGVGSGRGPGFGPGEGGGFGGGRGGGVSNGEGPEIMGSPGLINPVLVQGPRPHYTNEAIRAKAQGIVVLQGTIMPNGRVADVRVLRGLGYGLDAEAIRCVTTDWRFRPGMRDGTSVAVLATIEIIFTLR